MPTFALIVLIRYSRLQILSSHFLKLNCVIRYLLIGSFVTLAIVWSLPDTIAARNIALIVGAIASILYWRSTSYEVQPSMILVLLLLLAIPVWLILHLIFFQVDPNLQLKGLSSTWIRSTLGLMLGLGFGALIRKSTKYQLVTAFFLSALPLTTFFLYFYGQALDPGLLERYSGLYKAKAGATYMVMWAFLLSCGYVLFSFFARDSKNSKPTQLKAFLFLLIICLFDFVLMKSLNGILVSFICSGILFLLCGLAVYRNTKQYSAISRGSFLATVLVALVSFSIYVHYDRVHEHKLSNLLTDIRISTDIDQYESWHLLTADAPIDPVDPTGRIINVSTYYRVSWFLKGLRLITANPLGTGFVEWPFGYYMMSEYPGSLARHTHSAWVDFTLGAGIPGLLFLGLAMCLVVYLAIKKYRLNQNPWSLATVWMICGIALLWVIAEVSEREYIEFLIFMMALLAASNTIDVKEAS